jgi:beta-phosphoglucomutase-like phosphatase (HAD superfamily)
MFEEHAPHIFVQFDLDGVTVNSEVLKRPTYVQAVRELFGADCTVWDFADLLGLSRDETIAKLEKRFSSLELLETAPKFPERMTSIGERLLTHRLTLDSRVPMTSRPGVLGVLSALDELQVPRGIATSAHINQAIHSLTSVGAFDRFNDVVGVGTSFRERVVKKQKPSPEVYNISAMRMNATGLRIAIEDSLPGIQAAAASSIDDGPPPKTIYWHDPLVAPISREAQQIATLTTSSAEEIVEFIGQHC